MATHVTHVFLNQTLGTLAQNTALVVNTKIDSGRTQATRIKKFKYMFRFSGKTQTDGPIYFGFNRGNVSTSEIAEFFAADPQSSLDVPAIDRARFDVYPVGVMMLNTTVQPAITGDLPVFQHLAWPWKHMPEGDVLQMFAFNDGPALQTGTVLGLHAIIVEEFVRES